MKLVSCVPSPQLCQQRVSKGKQGQESKEILISVPLRQPCTSWAWLQAPAGCIALGGQLYRPQQAGGLEAAPALGHTKAELCTHHTPSPL